MPATLVTFSAANTSNESLLSASLSTISMISSDIFSACVYPFGQMLPAPPPSFDVNIFSGLYKLANGDALMLSITYTNLHDEMDRQAVD